MLAASGPSRLGSTYGAAGAAGVAAIGCTAQLLLLASKRARLFSRARGAAALSVLHKTSWRRLSSELSPSAVYLAAALVGCWWVDATLSDGGGLRAVGVDRARGVAAACALLLGLAGPSAHAAGPRLHGPSYRLYQPFLGGFGFVTMQAF
eukprot:5984282-Prymnesium_polylepis.1